MTRFFCDFCDTYLTHDSVRLALCCADKLLQQRFVTFAETSPPGALQIQVRKQHNAGYKHKVRQPVDFEAGSTSSRLCPATCKSCR